MYTEGVTARLMVDAGCRSSGWLVFATTGLGFGAHYGRTLLSAERFASLEDLFVSPSNPVAVVSQFELTWSSAVVFGVPLGGRTLSAFWGVSVDVPAAYTAGEFTSLSGLGALSDLQPGTRVGVILGRVQIQWRGGVGVFPILLCGPHLRPRVSL